MKKPASLITYLAALVIGIILLSMHEKVELLQAIVVTIGILITIPSAMMLLSSFFGKKNKDGLRTFPAWYTIVVAVAGLVLGIWMIVMPSFFEAAMVYTLGVVLILVGAAQIIFITISARPYSANVLWYCVPVLVIAGGFIICFIGPKGLNTWATLVTGILLIVSGANGMASLGRECKLERKYRGEEENLPSTTDDLQ